MMIRGSLCLTALVALLLPVPRDAAASAYPLESILPKEMAQKLEQAGITSTTDLVEKGATPRARARLAKAAGLVVGEITRWVKTCDLLRIKGVGPTMAKLLSAAKVESVTKLKQQKASPLYKRIVAANEKAKVTEKLPSEQTLEHWIGQAKKIKILVR